MSPKLHLILILSVPMIGAGIGAVLGMRFHREIEAAGIDAVVGFLGGGILGFITPLLLFKCAFHAHCPKCCGPMRYRSSQTIAYECNRCGHTYVTNVYPGD